MADNETAAPGQGRPLHIVNAPQDSSAPAPKRNGMKQFAKVPQVMKDQRRWCVWEKRASKTPGAKDRKFPMQVITDPKAWLTFEQAVELYDKGAVSGVGYQMLGTSEIIGLDLDNCIDPITQKANDFARQIVQALPESYVELSPSKKGIRIFVAAHPTIKVEGQTKQIEVYSGGSARYLTVTGATTRAPTGDLPVPSDAAMEMLRTLAKAENKVEREGAPVPDAPVVEEWKSLFTDNLLPYKKLGKKAHDYLEEREYPSDESNALHGVEMKLLEHGYTPERVYQIFISAPGSMATARSHYQGGENHARSYIWGDVERAVAKKKANEAKAASVGAAGYRTEHKNGQVHIINCPENVSKYFVATGGLTLNTRTMVIRLDGRDILNADLVPLGEKVCEVLGWKNVSKETLWSGIEHAATVKGFDPVVEYLNEVVWDGVSRLDTWLVELGFEDSEVNRLMARRWMIGAAGRMLCEVQPGQPPLPPGVGVQFDNMLVLEGPQGSRRSTLLRMLAPCEYFSDNPIDLNGSQAKDALLKCHMAALIEVAEMESFNSGTVDRVKSFITCRDDYLRPPYGRVTEHRARKFALAGSSNGPMKAKDLTGSRRFWPMRLTGEKVKLEWLEAHKDQIWAEAVACYRRGDTYWQDDTLRDLLIPVHERRAERAGWMVALQDRLRDYPTAGYFTLEELTRLDFNIPRNHTSDIGACLRDFGCTLIERTGIGAKKKDSEGKNRAKKENVWLLPWAGDVTDNPTAFNNPGAKMTAKLRTLKRISEVGTADDKTRTRAMLNAMAEDEGGEIEPEPKPSAEAEAKHAPPVDDTDPLS